jgi:hypothetical protein
MRTAWTTAFSGGFAIYDAPEPWGPWTTAYFTEAWDVGPGETGSFPTKWMSADGRSVALVLLGQRLFLRAPGNAVRVGTPTVAMVINSILTVAVSPPSEVAFFLDPPG